jgi:hypothetical protein
VLAAQAASKAAAESSVPLNDELPVPPPARLEYPTVEEDSKETPTAALHPASEAPNQPSDQSELPGVDSANPIIEESLAPPVLTETETVVDLDAETIQVPVVLETTTPGTDDPGSTFADSDAEIEVEKVEDTVVVAETIISEAPISETPIAPDVVFENIDDNLQTAEPPAPLEPVIKPSEQPVESTPAPPETDNKS